MTDNSTIQTNAAPKTDLVGNAEKKPENWTTGDEEMTGAQASYLKTLSEEAGQPEAYDTNLTKAEESIKIDELQDATGRSS